jgi:hypothetical protein
MKKNNSNKTQFSKEFETLLLKLKVKSIEQLGYISEDYKSDKDFLLNFSKKFKTRMKSNLFFPFISEDLKKDFKFLIEISQHLKDSILPFVSDELKSNEDFVLQIISIQKTGMIHLSSEMKLKKSFILEALKFDKEGFKYLPNVYKDDEEIVFEIFCKNPKNFLWASDALKSNKKFIEKCANKNKSVYNFACLVDEEIILKATQHDSFNAERINEETFTKNLCLKLINKKTSLYSYLPLKFKLDYDVALKAIQMDGNDICELQICFVGLKDSNSCFKFFEDETFMLESFKTSRIGFQFISDDLKNSTDFMKKAILLQPDEFYESSFEIKNDVDFVKKLMKKNPMMYQYATEECRSSRSLTMEMLKNIKNEYLDLYFPKCIPEKFQQDKEIVLLASRYELIFDELSKSLRNDIEFMKEAVKLNGRLANLIPKKLKNNKELMLDCVKKNYQNFGKVGPLKHDKDFVLKSLRLHPKIFKVVEKKFKHDSEVVWVSKRYFKLIREVPVQNISFHFQ